MKLKLLLFILISFVCIKGFSQDPMASIKKSKAEKDKDEQKLNAKGKAEYDKAKAEFKNLQNATFELAPNEIVNGDPKALLGLSNEKPDEKLAATQNEENKKNQKEINAKLKKDSKNDKADLNFDAKAPAPVGASWTDSWFWNPAYHTPVKNQTNYCGSCWAFATCAAFEHTYNKWWGIQLDLSEQDMVACGVTCWGFDAGSCEKGGFTEAALEYMRCKGVASETSYPYTATSGPCYARAKFKSAYTWGRIAYYYQRDWIKYYITIYGAVTTSMKSGISTFLSYGGGVYNGYPNTNPFDIDHVVTIVGWSDYLGAWIIKNSWGTGWGPYGGYAYVRYDNCNIGNLVNYVHPNY